MAETARGDVEGLCDICHRRPAAVRVTVSQNGRRQTLKVCDDDYARLQAQARGSSPFESLFGGSLFGDDVFGDFFGGDGVEGGDEADVDRGRGRARTRPRGRAADREAVDLAEYLSQQGEEILQQAARTAVEWGARDVDSEHLLHVLADNDVVQAVLARFKLSPQDLKRQVEELRPRRQGKAPEGREQVGVSPRVKAALEAAFRASRDLGHSYVGPEHLLIGLAEEEGLASVSYDRSAARVRWEKRAAAPAAAAAGPADRSKRQAARPGDEQRAVPEQHAPKT